MSMRRPPQCGARRYEPDASSGPQRIRGAGVYNLPVKLRCTILPPSRLALSSGSASHVVRVRMTSFVVRSCDDRPCIACATMSESTRVISTTFAIIRLAADRIRIQRGKRMSVSDTLSMAWGTADELLPDAVAKVPRCGRGRTADDGLRHPSVVLPPLKLGEPAGHCVPICGLFRYEQPCRPRDRVHHNDHACLQLRDIGIIVDYDRSSYDDLWQPEVASATRCPRAALPADSDAVGHGDLSCGPRRSTQLL